MRTSSRAPEVLVVTEYFVPGIRGGGTVTAVVNAIEQLKSSFTFDVLTSDRDLGASAPYPNVTRGAWCETAFGKVYRVTPAQRQPVALFNVLRDVPFDLVYLNSFFAPLTFHVLVLRRFGFLRNTPVILAPRGELAASALRVRRLKKWVYEKVTRLRLLENVIWQASSDHEARDITDFFERHHGRTVRCVVTGEVPGPPADLPEGSRRPKRVGQVRAIFIGRVHRIKNLDAAIRLLGSTAGDIELTVVGPVEDAEYWQECQQLIAVLPSGKTVRWVGVVPRTEVGPMLIEADLMILPTRGENFGHAILEALMAGCPVLTSDQTPWRGLASRGIGWDVPIDDVEAAQAALSSMMAMGPEAHEAMRKRAKAFARTAVPNAARLHEDLFRLALR